MTNLTDLLPAGAGGKQVSFTASGAISSGQTVGLNSDGTVSVIDASTGDVATFTSNRQTYTTAVYDATNDRIVVFYRDQGDSDKGKAIVGTVSGTSISFGTAVQFEAGLTNSIDAVFDPDSGKILVSYEDDTNSSYGTAIVGTVSGTSISFGTAVVFASVNTTTTSITYDTNLDRVAIAFAPFVSYRRGEGIAGQVSGTSITFGSSVQFDTDNTGNTSIDLVSIVFDSTNNKVVIVYTGASQKIQGVVGTISGTSISFGTPADVSAVTDYRQPKAVFDSNAGKVFAIFRDNSDSYIKGAVGTVSGTSMSFGTTATLSSITATNYPSAVYDPDNQNIKAIFKQSASPNSTYVFTATISGTSVSASGEKVLYAAGAEAQQNSMTYDTSSNQVISAVRVNTTDIGEAFVHKSGSGIPNTNFIGIADAAISDTASGNITIKGGIAGTVAYDSGIGPEISWTESDTTTYLQGLTYDSNAQKIVIAYRAGSTSDGTAVVGDVSGVNITYGTNTAFTTDFADWIDIAYDANAQKVVIAYNNSSDSDHGYAVVGTVSGTSISFGTPVKFEAGGSYFISIVYDTNAQKVVIVYRDSGNSSYGTAIVGTVSGTSISYGTAVVYNSGITSEQQVTYDSTNNKVVIAYSDESNGNYGTAVVGTVSGTSISFGSETVYESAFTDCTSATYDVNAQKVVVAYKDNGNSNYGTAVVGTVSGTSISFGTPVVFHAGSMGTQLHDIEAKYDPSTQTVLIAFRDNSESNYGKTVVGTVSGTSISFTSAVTFNEDTTLGMRLTYDSNQQKMVMIYDDQGNTPDTISRVYTPDTTLTPNTTYYVQSDGTLSTTSSSVTAGKALSATSINLDYSS